MRKLMMAAVLAACAAGCRVVKVENFGEEIARDADDKPVLLADGRLQTIKKGWSVYHNQHWMITEADQMNATIKPEAIEFSLNGLNTKPDGENVNALVKNLLDGAANLAAKIGAAVSSSGGSASADAVSAMIGEFFSKGGDPNKATVTVTDGNIVCTDGTCTISGACSDGSCEVK